MDQAEGRTVPGEEPLHIRHPVCVNLSTNSRLRQVLASLLYDEETEGPGG